MPQRGKDWRVPVAVAHFQKHHLYETCEAYREIGRWAGFFTTQFAVRPGRLRLAARANLPRVSPLATKLLRYHDPRVAEDVWLYAPSLPRRLGLRALGAKRFLKGASFGNAVADWAVERRVAVHSHVTGALEIFERLEPEGLPCLLEMYLGDRTVGREMLLLEFESLNVGISEHLMSISGLGLEHVERTRRECELADLVYCPSPFVIDSMIGAGVPREKIVFAPYGATLPPTPGSFAARKPDEPLRVAFIGTEGIRKGMVHLLEAVKRLRPHVELHVFGLTGFEVENNPPFPTEGVTFHGFLPKSEMMDWLARIHVGCLPSLFEGSAIGVYDFLGAGIPVVVTRNTGTLVTDGEEGFVVPVRRADVIVEALEALMADEARRQEMGRKALELARRNSWAHYREETVRPLLERAP